ncbi:alpha/beta hydrolase family protein [Puniceicoccus vermicola]|uniref:Alpha/beta hydrolase n=1 Tax=Puniceicoccus vermicola TaxID=388746 RepID=A0A7X1AZD0_9BACT|nr:alpha/beta hydrolase [Puniceicoccus vermicola]MBC2602729.1 alpha/beta hydrolase [Puniceicoccus vermicola]
MIENCCITLQELGAERADWQGFQGWILPLGDISLRIVLPREFADGRPWFWRPEFFEPFANTDVMLLEKGWARVFLDLPNHYGCPKAVERFEEMYQFVTGKLGLAPKMGIVALSRAGLSAYNYASEHPDHVCGIYADNPVCDFRSWPGGAGVGPGSEGDWQNLLGVYDLTDEEARAYEKQPLSTKVLQPIAEAGIPVFHVCGDSDETVPYEENTVVLRDRFKELGGSYEEILKPGGKHHPHGLEDPTPVVNFLLRSFSRR